MENKENLESAGEQLKINFNVPAKMPSVVAHHMIVSEYDGQTVLMFFEVLPPLIISNDPEDRSKVIDKLKGTGVVAECVAKVTIAQHKLPDFARVLNGVAERFQQQMQEIEDQYAKSNKDTSES